MKALVASFRMVSSARVSVAAPKRFLVAALLVLTLLSTALTVQAKVALPSVFGDFMVLQRDAPVPVWGTADPGETVTVTFRDQTTTTGADGQWRVALDPMPAPADQPGYTLVVKGAANTVTYADVLIGEVWFGAGQSNMAVQYGGYASKETLAATDHPQIRLNCNLMWPDSKLWARNAQDPTLVCDSFISAPGFCRRPRTNFRVSPSPAPTKPSSGPTDCGNRGRIMEITVASRRRYDAGTDGIAAGCEMDRGVQCRRAQGAGCAFFWN